MTERAGERSVALGFFERAGLPRYELQPLDDAAATALLQDRFPALAPRVRRRLLAEAQGNPLALLELPVALDLHHAAAGGMPAVLPLSRRLQAMFAARISDLPALTFQLLLLAVLSGTGDLRLLRDAGKGNGEIEGLAPAERARLVRIDPSGGRLVFLLGNDAFFTGQRAQLTEVTEEGLMLCQTHEYRLLAWPGLFLQALLAAARGGQDTAEALAAQMAGWAAPRGVRAVQNYAWHVLALAALGRADFEDAYRHAAAVSPAGVLASHVPHALWLIMDLVEAAVRSGRHDEAAAHVAAVSAAGIAGISPRLAMITHGSAAMACADETYGELFETALAIPGAERWPFDQARIQLAYGERLRRVKATTAARAHLTAARDTFQRLSARPWTTRAYDELRAAGLTPGPGQAGGRPPSRPSSGRSPTSPPPA